MSTAQNSGAYTPAAPSTATPGTTDVAREQVSEVGQSAGGAAAHVARHSKDQVGEVAAEAQRQVRDLLGEARTQVSQQVGTQRDRLTETLMSVGSELEEMADKGGQGGLASEVARQASGRIVAMAGHIEGREPADLLDELRSVARRRPAVFLVGVLTAGVVAGRLTRGVKDDSSDSPPGRALPAGVTATVPALGTSAVGSSASPYAAPVAPPVAPPIPADPLRAPVAGEPAADVSGRSVVGERAAGAGPLIGDEFGRRGDGGL